MRIPTNPPFAKMPYVGWVVAIGFAIKVMIFDSYLIENEHYYQPTIFFESFGGLDIKSRIWSCFLAIAASYKRCRVGWSDCICFQVNYIRLKPDRKWAFLPTHHLLWIIRWVGI